MKQIATMYETARLFFWGSIIALIVVLALWRVNAAALLVIGWALGAFTVMGAQLAKEERESP